MQHVLKVNQQTSHCIKLTFVGSCFGSPGPGWKNGFIASGSNSLMINYKAINLHYEDALHYIQNMDQTIIFDMKSALNRENEKIPVSYTHLTLPTILLV